MSSFVSVEDICTQKLLSVSAAKEHTLHELKFLMFLTSLLSYLQENFQAFDRNIGCCHCLFQLFLFSDFEAARWHRFFSMAITPLTIVSLIIAW